MVVVERGVMNVGRKPPCSVPPPRKEDEEEVEAILLNRDDVNTPDMRKRRSSFNAEEVATAINCVYSLQAAASSRRMLRQYEYR